MKVWNYVFIFVTLSLILWMAGIEVVGVKVLLNTLGFLDSNGIIDLNSSNTMRVAIITLLIAAVGAALVIGFITKSQSENYVILPIITGVGVTFGIITFIDLSYSIISYGFSQADWVGYITLAIFGPLAIGFILSLIEFFRGTD